MHGPVPRTFLRRERTCPEGRFVRRPWQKPPLRRQIADQRPGCAAHAVAEEKTFGPQLWRGVAGASDARTWPRFRLGAWHPSTSTDCRVFSPGHAPWGHRADADFNAPQDRVDLQLRIAACLLSELHPAASCCRGTSVTAVRPWLFHQGSSRDPSPRKAHSPCLSRPAYPPA